MNSISIDEAVRDERERCALLCEDLGAMFQHKADGYRNDGTFTSRSIWPPFKKKTFVAPAWERSASRCELVVNALETMARCIRAGYDPRHRPKIVVHSAPVTDDEMRDALRKAHGLS